MVKIEIVGPYATLYRVGYVRTDSTGRRRLDLKNSNLDRTTITYAKYLMSIRIGRFIDENIEQVDHIDNDRTNDDIENLQILTISEHINKSKTERNGRTYIKCVCAYCNCEFERELRQMYKNYKNTFCSRSCNGKYYASVLATPSKR